MLSYVPANEDPIGMNIIQVQFFFMLNEIVIKFLLKCYDISYCLILSLLLDDKICNHRLFQ